MWEEVAVSQEQQNSAVPMPELEQAVHQLVAQNGIVGVSRRM